MPLTATARRTTILERLAKASHEYRLAKEQDNSTTRLHAAERYTRAAHELIDLDTAEGRTTGPEAEAEELRTALSELIWSTNLRSRTEREAALRAARDKLDTSRKLAAARKGTQS